MPIPNTDFPLTIPLLDTHKRLFVDTACHGYALECCSGLLYVLFHWFCRMRTLFSVPVFMIIPVIFPHYFCGINIVIKHLQFSEKLQPKDDILTIHLLPYTIATRCCFTYSSYSFSGFHPNAYLLHSLYVQIFKWWRRVGVTRWMGWKPAAVCRVWRWKKFQNSLQIKSQ